MDERDRVEYPEQQTLSRQSSLKKTKSEIKHEKKMSKTESRFKSKLESLKKLQHSASTNSAVEKARAFFRSLERKHLGGSSSSNEHSSSSSPRRRLPTIANDKHHEVDYSSSSGKFPLPSSMSSSSSSLIIDDTQNTFSLTTTNDSTAPADGIATARLIRVINSNYSNAKDVIVQRVIRDERDYHDRSQSYSVSLEKHRQTATKYDSRPLSPTSSRNPNIIYSSQTYSQSPPTLHPTRTNGNISNHHMSTSMYNYRPLVCRHIESPSLMSSSFHEQSDRLVDTFIPPLPASSSSSSMASWSQSVRRLNSEYTSTINALQEAKESLKEIYPDRTETISKYANLVARGIDNLSTNETKRSLGVTFCLTAPMASTPSLSPPSQPSKSLLEQSKPLPMNMFCKPKLVRPLDLDTFIPSIPSLPKLEPVPSIAEKNDKTDGIADIIKRFNKLNTSTPSLKSQTVIDNHEDSLLTQYNNEQREAVPKVTIFDSMLARKDQSNLSSLTSLTDLNPSCSNSSPRVHFEPSVTTYEIEEIPYESPPPPLSSSSSTSISEDSTSSSTSSLDENQVYENTQSDNMAQEETTYTVETFYKSNSANDIRKPHASSSNQEVVVIRENTTEEHFNLAREKLQAEKNRTRRSPLKHTFTTNESEVPALTTPLLTYLNVTVKQTSPVLQRKETIYESYHSVEPVVHDFLSSSYHQEDDETINDVVTSNPHTHSPPSHCLISSTSSSSSSTASSASTVLLSNNTPTKTPSTTNGNLSKNNNNKSVSQLPKRTLSTPTTTPSSITSVSRLKQPSKSIAPVASKLKPPSSTISKPLKSMITNSSSSVPTSMLSALSVRRSAAITNPPSTLTNNVVNKPLPQQVRSYTSNYSPLSTLASAKKANSINGTNMSESPNSADSSCALGKNRVRSMVNQLNAAVSTTSPATPSVLPAKRVPAFLSAVNVRRPGSTESTSRPSITSPTRPLLQRAVSINVNGSLPSSPPSTPPTSGNNIPSAYKRKAPLVRSMSNVKEGLLRWCQAQVAGYPNVSVTNLSSSWSDGLAFCALIHHFFPDAFDFDSLSPSNRKENFELAFHTAEERAGVPRLLDVSDMLIMGNSPDYKCIFTYLNSFLAKVKDMHPNSNGVEHH